MYLHCRNSLVVRAPSYLSWNYPVQKFPFHRLYLLPGTRIHNNVYTIFHTDGKRIILLGTRGSITQRKKRWWSKIVENIQELHLCILCFLLLILPLLFPKHEKNTKGKFPYFLYVVVFLLVIMLVSDRFAREKIHLQDVVSTSSIDNEDNVSPLLRS